MPDLGTICPVCGAPTIARYSHVNGPYDQCAAGHTYWESEAVEPHGFESYCGWIDHPDRAAVAAELPRFGDVARPLFRGVDDGRPILLYKVLKAVFSAYPGGQQWPAQQIGDCVSFGHGHANDLSQAIRVYLGDMDVAHVHATCTEFIYGTSREVAGILGPKDGSYGGAAVKAMAEIGLLPRSEVGPYDGHRAEQWGLRGVPSDVKAKAAKYKMPVAAANVSTWDELVAAIGNGYPVTICSGQGFSMTRDQQGFCRAQGRWGHCMFISGVRFDRPGANIVQSWGPDTPSGPLDLDQLPNSFWAERNVIERILGQGDSWAIASSPTFEAQPLPAHLRAA